jgi:hypothetical protein
MEGPFTPFVAATLGYYYMDSRIASGPSQYFAWWDNWWGVGGWTRYTPTATRTWLTVGFTGGIRYSPVEHFYLALSYGLRWIDTEEAMPATSRINLAAIWNF